ncbi:MAG: FecR family protein [Polaromonas sp.]
MQIFKPKLRHLIALLCLAATSAMAQDKVIGFIKTVDANASVVIAGQAVPARPGMALELGQVLKTGKPGSMGVMLKDNTSLSLGPDSELILEEYLYAPGSGELKLALNFVKGSLHYVSGVIAKLRPDAVSIKTPVSTIGVRGTQFAVNVAPEVKP